MNQDSQMYKDALLKVHKALPSLNGVEYEQIKFEPDTILPWYDRFAWRFGPKDGYYVVVVIGGRETDPGSVNYLSHISYRQSTECTFHPFQVSDVGDAIHANAMIDFYLRLNLKQDKARLVNKAIESAVDEMEQLGKKTAYENWKPGHDLPDTSTDDYILYGKIHTRGDIMGLKELYVDDIIKGDRFYVPLPAYIGGNLDEQKFLIGLALKDIAASAIRFGPYIPHCDTHQLPVKAAETLVNNVIESATGEMEQLDRDYVVTKEPFAVNFTCNECGCEFNLPAHKCERQKIGTSWTEDSPNDTQFAAKCPRCGTKCKVKRIIIEGKA